MSTSTPPRLAYIDNVRSVMIFLVVAMHAAVTYSHFGSWYYNAPEPIGRLDGLLFGLFQSHLQAFFMGLLFLIAGYFSPTAYDRKGFWRFIADRFVRLGLPALFYIFVIHDTMGHYLLGWHGSDPFWPSYVYYLSHGDWVDGTGPMWFAVALLAFSLVYALGRAAFPRARLVLKTPGVIGVLAGGVFMIVLTFLVRQSWPVGTSWHNMQFCYFAQYVALFAVGILARRGDWFATFSRRGGFGLLIGAAIAGPLIWLGVMVFGNVTANGMDAFNGGWHWQCLVSAAWEQMFAAAMCAGIVVWFRECFGGSGRLSKLVKDNSFGIYVFHPPVLVAVSLAMASLRLPPLAMFVLAAIAAFLTSLALVHLVVRRIPLLKSIM